MFEGYLGTNLGLYDTASLYLLSQSHDHGCEKKLKSYEFNNSKFRGADREEEEDMWLTRSTGSHSSEEKIT